MSSLLRRPLAAVGILVLTAGVDCLGPCGPLNVEIELHDFVPAGGTVVSEDTITFTVSGTEEASDKMLYRGYSLDWADLQRWDGAYWRDVEQLHWWTSGSWESAGECSVIRTIEMTFEDVPLNVGQNRFRVAMYIDASDVQGYWTYSDEVVYDYQP
ncbi:MAG: hypothetical protein JXQ73_10955 [Phycisphaerae bacterium]|nr:hypothetical protein [Phycisphaerae bacterium]